MPSRSGGGRRAGTPNGAQRYPRTARVNQVLREVIADEIERITEQAGDDGRDGDLGLITVTGVSVEPDLRHATVWLSSLSAAGADALAAERVRIQAAIGRQVRLKRTPLLTFAADPGVALGTRIDDLLRTVDDRAGAERVDP